ncbi:MAG: hypothetical protein M1827_006213 [Pycnora praestabilis]|nr:MAG: hypothetical protein M1827_006213 [Pycnora praestabilis]
MAEESPQPASIQARIAALNLGHVGRGPGSPPPTAQSQTRSQPRAPAPPPPINRPSIDQRRKTTNYPPTQSHGSAATRQAGNEPIGVCNDNISPPPTIFRSPDYQSQSPKPSLPPRLPPRRPSQASPSLPPRRPSEQMLARRDSTESISSTVSGISSISALSIGTARTSTSRSPSIDAGSSSRVRAPAYDPSTLPPLPPKKSKEEKKNAQVRIPLKPTYSSPVITVTKKTPPPTPALPPRLPARRSELLGDCMRDPVELPSKAHLTYPKRSALSFGLNKPIEPPTISNSITNDVSTIETPKSTDPTPPPVPFASRPNLSQLQASKPRPSPQIQSSDSCLKCRDFSGPDSHAARFPRESIPSTSIDWLASQLCSPFPSSTDKARSIFTWLHHNVAYDTAAFFSGNLKPSTPSSTLSSGLAVCEGYAGLFAALAIKAGLEAVVVSGHGAGYGHVALRPGDPIPPFSTGHAWNAVRIDNGQWKLIDACWGAGNVSGSGGKGNGSGSYTKAFKPERFIQDNEEFGLDHFPSDDTYFFRADGCIPTWEEYILPPPGGERPQVYSVASDLGLSAPSFTPTHKQIPISTLPSAQWIRFQFTKLCPHYTFPTSGPKAPYVFVLAVNGSARAREKNKKDFVPFETTPDHAVWWLDIAPQDLGEPGQDVSCFFVRTIGDDDGRGWSVDRYREAKGRKGMGFGGAAKWELV